MRVLFVSIAFPPRRDPECLQTARYFRYLSNQENVTVDVVTAAAPVLNMPVDASLAHYDQGYEQKIEVPLPESKIGNLIKRWLVPGSLNRPDSKQAFAKAAPFVMETLHRKPDVIYSRSFPVSSTILAGQLKRSLKVPWLAHLSDPWADSPIGDCHAAAREYNLKAEKEYLKLADQISLTTTKTIEMYAQRYPSLASRMSLFPNVYDPADNQHPEENQGTRLRVVHTGGLTGTRTPEPLFRAIEHLAEDDPRLLDSLEVILAGDADRPNRKLIKSGRSCVKWLGQLSFEDARSLQARADLLVCIEAPISNPENAVFFPSKVLDYVLTRKPAFAITTSGSQIEQVFQKLGWHAFEHSDSKGCARFLKASIAKKQRGEAFVLQESLPLEYDAQHNASRLVSELKRLAQT
jgi:hypothetical protein